MLNASLKKYTLFQENLLKGIKQNGFATKFKTLSGYSSIGRAAQNLKSQLQSDSQNTDQVVNILSVAIQEADFVDVGENIDIQEQTSYYIPHDVSESTMPECIDDLYTLIHTQGDDDNLVITLCNGNLIHLEAEYQYLGGSYANNVYMIFKQSDDTEARHLFAQVIHDYNTDKYISCKMCKIYKMYKTGGIIALSDFTSLLVQNYEVLNMCSSAIVTENRDIFTKYDLSGLFSKFARSEGLANDIKHEIISIANDSGLQGVISYIQAMYKDLNSVQEDSDGLLSFTENNNFASISILTGILQIASALITTVIMMISRIAGVILAIISAIVNVIIGIVQKVQEAIDASYAIENDTLESDPCAVVGVDQIDVSVPGTYDFATQPAIIRNFLSNKAPVLTHLYGHYGLWSCNDTTIRFEKHIDFYNRIDAFKQLGVIPAPWYNIATDGTETVFTLIGSNMKSAYFGQLSNQVFETPDYHNSLDGHLSIADDRKLRLIYAFNLIFDLSLTNSDFELPSLTVNFATSNYAISKLNGHGGAEYQNQTLADQMMKVLTALYVYLFETDPLDNFTNLFDDFCSWDVLLQLSVALPTNDLQVPLGAVLHKLSYDTDQIMSVLDNTHCELLTPLQRGINPLYDIPRVDRRKLYGEIAGLAAATIAIAVTTVVAVGVIGSKIKKQRLANTLKVEAAWDAAKESTNPDTMKAYRKAVKKNNMFASIFGGTKYNKLDYWNSSSDSNIIAASSTLLDSAAMNLDQKGVTLDTIQALLVG